jgi:hypothetical protein
MAGGQVRSVGETRGAPGARRLAETYSAGVALEWETDDW